MRERRAWGACALAVLGACAGAPRPPEGTSESSFECKNRRAEYQKTGGFMYAETRVRMRCGDGPPVVERHAVLQNGEERKTEGTIAGHAFDRAWREIEDVGWRRVIDCKNPKAAKDDPIYLFEITDGDTTRTLTCKGEQLPFPFDVFLNVLDTIAGSVPAPGE